MSRLIVKNLPAYLNEARLREHFSSKGGVITDTKLARRSDGTSRRFGFVGFKTEQEAQEALQYFHKTFIDTARIDVSIARAVADEVSLKERRVERETELRRQEEKGAAEAASKNTGESKKRPSRGKGVNFDEFMAIMAPKKKRKTWQNEEGEDGETKLDRADFAEEAPKQKKKAQATESAGAAKVLDAAIKASEGKENDDDAQDATVHDEGMTDLEYMYKRMKRKVGEEAEEQDKKFEQSDSEADDDEQQGEAQSDMESIDEEEVKRQERERAELEKKARQDQENVDAIMASGRLFIRNLPFDATEEELERYFSRSGEVTQVSFECNTYFDDEHQYRDNREQSLTVC